jgi:hypothetical protein
LRLYVHGQRGDPARQRITGRRGPHVLRMPCYVSRADVETVSLRLASVQQVLARV